MTMYGYEIRNEYGLGAPELYKTAYQDDPEDILEGVAVAGLVGFLRQLGDLAEYAAGVFHGLHEELANTASRSQSIMLRVQQLEADLPVAEKDLFHNSCTDFASIEGIIWHLNLETDTNIVSKEEMPHYVMEFYKQSRGPPQLFRLDKFDKAGSGACLKRHTDPSFFKVDLSSYGVTHAYQRETRTIKQTIKLNPISSDIIRSLRVPNSVSRSEMGTRNQDSDEIPIRRVKLKQKQFKGSLLGQMENLLETESPTYEKISRGSSHISTEFEEPKQFFTSVEKISTNTSHKRLISLGSLINHSPNRQDTSSSDENDDSPSSELLSSSSATQQYQIGSPTNQDTESGENSDGYISEATASEVEFMDALTETVDSEVETDSDKKEKHNPSLIHVKSRKFSSEGKEVKKDSTLFRSKSSCNTDETEQVPITPVAGTEDTSAPISDGDLGKNIHDTEPPYEKFSFKKVASKKVSYEENEYNPVTTNEINGAKATPKLQKDSFSHSLRHMAKQLLELKQDLTEEEEEEEEVDSQDLEENEDEFLFDRADVQESGIVEKDEYIIERVESGNFSEVNQAEINSIAASLGEDQTDLTSQDNDLHGFQNIKTIKSEESNTSEELGEHEVHISSDAKKDGEKRGEILMNDTVSENTNMDRIANNEISQSENLNLIKMEKLDCGEDLHADKTPVELTYMGNGEDTEKTVSDIMVSEPQNLTLVEKEQKLAVSETHLDSNGMQHDDEIQGHGTVTETSNKEEVFYTEMPDDQNECSEEGEEFCESDMNMDTDGVQNVTKETEMIVSEEMLDSDISESETPKSNEYKQYESEIHIGSDDNKIQGHGTVTKTSVKEEVFYTDMPDDQNEGSEEGEEFCESDMNVDTDSVQNVTKETEMIVSEEVLDSDISESETPKSNEYKQYESKIHVGLDDNMNETYEIPVDGTENEILVEAEDFNSDIEEVPVVNSIKTEEEFIQNEIDTWSYEMQLGQKLYELPTISTVDENLVTAEAMQENLLQQQNSYYGDETQIPASKYSIDEVKSLGGNLTEPWNSGIGDVLSVEALVDRYELLEGEARATEVNLISPRPLIKENILLEALINDEELLEEDEREEDEVQAVPVASVPLEEIEEASAEADSAIPVPGDPVTVLDTGVEDEVVTPVGSNLEVITLPVDQVIDLDPGIHDVVVNPVACNPEVTAVPVDQVIGLDLGIHDVAVTPVACNPELIPVPIDRVIDLHTGIQDVKVNPVAYNSEVIPDRVVLFPPIPSSAPTYNAAQEEGDVAPPLPPLPPIQWRMGKPQMGPLHISPMAPPQFSKFGPLPSFDKLGKPPRPKPSKGAKDRQLQLHNAQIEQTGENYELLTKNEETNNSVMLPSLENKAPTNQVVSVKEKPNRAVIAEKNPASDETIQRREEVPAEELAVQKVTLSTGDGKFKREMEEEPRKKPPPVPAPPKYPLFQITSHDNSILKKAPSLIQPANRLITPSMLEEIKNKSCTLKPVMVRKPNFMAPYSRTNLKVAAMLEKANAIRQAVGSDDSDNDSWSE